MRRLLLTCAVAFAAAAPAPSPAAPPAAQYAPPPRPIPPTPAPTPAVQPTAAGGGLPYLGSATSYNAGDWENVLRRYHDEGTYDREVEQIVDLADRYTLRAARRLRAAASTRK